jgi:hypothetical protein
MCAGKLIQANVAARAHYLIDTHHHNIHPNHEDTLDPGAVMTLRTVFESCVWESEEAMEACMSDMFETCSQSSTFEIEVIDKSLHIQYYMFMSTCARIHIRIHMLTVLYLWD